MKKIIFVLTIALIGNVAFAQSKKIDAEITFLAYSESTSESYNGNSTTIKFASRSNISSSLNILPIQSNFY